MLVFKHFIPISFQRWFLDKGYQKFCYFKHFISPKVHLTQKHLQILLTPQNLNPFQSEPPHWKVVYDQFKNHLANFCSQILISLNFVIVNNIFSSLYISFQFQFVSQQSLGLVGPKKPIIGNMASCFAHH